MASRVFALIALMSIAPSRPPLRSEDPAGDGESLAAPATVWHPRTIRATNSTVSPSRSSMHSSRSIARVNAIPTARSRGPSARSRASRWPSRRSPLRKLRD